MRGGGGNGDCTRSIVRTVSTGCGPPSVLRPGCYICKRWFLLITGTGLAVPLWGGQTSWHRAYNVNASKKVTLRVSICSGADSEGSKGAVNRPSRTTDKSQEGTARGAIWSKPSDAMHKGGDHPMPSQGDLIQLSPSCNGRYVNPQGGSSRPCCQPLLQKLQHWTNRAVNWVYCTSQTPGLKDAPLGRVQLPSSGGSGDGLRNLDK